MGRDCGAPRLAVHPRSACPNRLPHVKALCLYAAVTDNVSRQQQDAAGDDRFRHGAPPVAKKGPSIKAQLCLQAGLMWRNDGGWACETNSKVPGCAIWQYRQASGQSVSRSHPMDFTQTAWFGPATPTSLSPYSIHAHSQSRPPRCRSRHPICCPPPRRFQREMLTVVDRPLIQHVVDEARRGRD